MRTIEQVLEMARWAPSGDNTQVWRFEILADDRVRVHGSDTRDWCVYDMDGHASQLAIGAMLETLAIAATEHGWRTEVERLPDSADHGLRFDVCFSSDPDLKVDPLCGGIRSRTVQRRPMKSRRLTANEKMRCEQAVEPCKIAWFEGPGPRWQLAKLNFHSANIRLTIPEAYLTHTRVIEWGARFSDDRIPEAAIGIDPLTAKLMKFVLKSWSRVEFFNRWLCGTLAPRLQLDLVPGMACSAHLAVFAPAEPVTVDDRIECGRAIQRLWLTCEQLGLQLQPEMTPLIFSHYVRTNKVFTTNNAARLAATNIHRSLKELLMHTEMSQTFWMCRVGPRRSVPGRSLRLDLARLTRLKP